MSLSATRAPAFWTSPASLRPLSHPHSELLASLKGFPALVPHPHGRHDQLLPVPALFLWDPTLVLTTLSTPQWRAFLPGLKFEVIGSTHLSLYTGKELVPLWGVALWDSL